MRACNNVPCSSIARRRELSDAKSYGVNVVPVSCCNWRYRTEIAFTWLRVAQAVNKMRIACFTFTRTIRYCLLVDLRVCCCVTSNGFQCVGWRIQKSNKKSLEAICRSFTANLIDRSSECYCDITTTVLTACWHLAATFYAAVIISRVTAFACPSVRLSFGLSAFVFFSAMGS